MSHANYAPLVNRSKLEAEIQCGSHADACNGLRHTDFLHSRHDCAKDKVKRIVLTSDTGR
ncbi:hypothetical protein SJS34_03150 [Aeromonas caviae]|nr:hypothetical protein [Aeromonas caviae]